MQNEFSDTWFALFLDPIPAKDSDTETAFVLRHLPPGSFRSLLDLCCGPGRHAKRLAALGYYVLGVDNNAGAIARAERSAAPHTRFLVHDMRDIGALDLTFDGVVNLWHSFGYFDDTTNADILRQIRDKLRPGGRFVLDIYNRDCLERLPQRRQFEKDGVHVVTEYQWSGKRVTCSLTYDHGAGSDRFEWRIYTPDEIREIAGAAGL
ncbi:MAG TPA: class I SAM-dependent methyltransferase, partial [Roseiflexaceae bacterium]|nr:class I SAM-dependent methyltransferase [Roseiflexaceae bacterium]